MAAISTIIAGIGLGIAAAGAGIQAYGTMQQSEASQKAERLRNRQMNLEATRRRRQIIREMIINQAQGRANAANQGATGGDSAVLGAQAQQTNSAAQNTLATNQSQQIGQGIFNANAQYAQGQVTSSWGGNISSVGGSIMKNAGTIARVGATEGLWSSDT
jgi:hypothetical protein